MPTTKPYVAPFIYRLMPNASEAEILEASENLKAYLLVLYRAFLTREAKAYVRDSLGEEVHGRLTSMGRIATTPMKSFVGYIRVSSVKQGQLGSSLQEQKDAILAFAARQQLHIVEWYEDRETAAKKGRTQFMRMMASLEKRKAGGVILHKIDRGARNLWDWARIQDLIDAGIEVHFAHDNLDLRSRGGRLAADIQAVVAADYVRNLREEVRKGMQGRLKQGILPGRAPVGYLNEGKAKPKTIDPIKGPIVRAAFELYATKRYSFERLAVELQRRGLTRSGGRPLSLNGIATILHNPFYTGIIRLKTTGEVFQGIHEPLVDARTFQTVQDIINGKDNAKTRRFRFTYRGLLTCGLCSHRLTGELQKSRVYYRCHTKACETKGVREDFVDARLKEETSALHFSEEDIAAMQPYLEEDEGERERRRDAAVGALKLRMAALENRERRLIDAYVDEALDRDAYNQRKASLLLELAEVRDELKRVEANGHGVGMEGVRRFFEPINTLRLSHDEDAPDVFADALEKLTSNPTLMRKKLDLPLRSPFREVKDDLLLLFHEPSRSTFRKRTPLHTESGKKAVQKSISLAEHRARILIKHLRDWKEPAPTAAIARRAPLPQWFKPKSPEQPSP